jgi:hypothetical protein
MLYENKINVAKPKKQDGVEYIFYFSHNQAPFGFFGIVNIDFIFI